MSLWSFIQERCSVLGIPVARMAEKNNISNITLERIKKNGQIKPATKEKLARGMLCTIREIDTAIAQDEQVTPFGETVKPEQPSVMETVDKLEKLITPEPKEAYDLTEEEKELNGVGSFEELKKKQHPDGGLHLYNVRRSAEEEVNVNSLLLKTTAADYQSYLRELILHQLVEAEPGATVETLWIRIGQMVAKEVL